VRIGEVYDAKIGKFKFLEPALCLFYPRIRSFGTPLALKGRIVWNGDLALIEGRLPGAAIVGGVAWSVCWIVLILVFLTDPQRSMLDVVVAVGGLVGGALIFAISLAIARWQVNRIVDEIRMHLTPNQVKEATQVGIAGGGRASAS
jgi:hypothetical protein